MAVSLIVLVGVLALGLPAAWVGAVHAESAPAATATPQPQMMRRVDPLTCPTLPAQPAQADQGAQVFCQVCMTCHGDVGQGLAAFRPTLDPVDQNCWQSKCHAANHPPDGFTFPTDVPAIIGPGKIEQFKTALGLHDFIQAVMPYQAPGSLTDAEYWQLTAFLLRANGYDPGAGTLNAQTAAQIDLQPVSPPPPAEGPAVWPYFAIGGALLAAALALALARLRAKR